MSRMTTRRKLAIASWSAPSEPNIYGKLTVDATRALAYLDAERARTGEKVTITHLVGKAVANALRKAPTLNGRIVFGRFVPHGSVDIAFLVSLEEGGDLAKAKISDVDTKPVASIARELREKVERLRNGLDCLRSCVLIEVWVDTTPQDFDLGRCCQERPTTPSTQVPCDDTWLDASGRHVVGKFDKLPRQSRARVAFFLYYFQADRPIYTLRDEPLTCPSPRHMPRRLRQIMKWDYPT